MEISPMAQVALLHTEINSGFRLSPRMGMNSAEGKKYTPFTIQLQSAIIYILQQTKIYIFSYNRY